MRRGLLVPAMTSLVRTAAGVLVPERPALPAPVDTLPADPVDKQVVVYQNAAMVTAGVKWLLQYDDNSGSPATYPWVFVGGSGLEALVGPAIEGTSSPTYVDLTTPGPTVTAPLAGVYEVTMDVYYVQQTAAGQYAYMAPKIGAAAASDIDGTILAPFASGNHVATLHRTKRLTVAASTAVKLQYRASGGLANFQDRSLSLTPVRVSA